MIVCGEDRSPVEIGHIDTPPPFPLRVPFICHGVGGVLHTPSVGVALGVCTVKHKGMTAVVHPGVVVALEADETGMAGPMLVVPSRTTHSFALAAPHTALQPMHSERYPAVTLGAEILRAGDTVVTVNEARPGEIIAVPREADAHAAVYIQSGLCVVGSTREYAHAVAVSPILDLRPQPEYDPLSESVIVEDVLDSFHGDVSPRAFGSSEYSGVSSLVVASAGACAIFPPGEQGFVYVPSSWSLGAAFLTL